MGASATRPAFADAEPRRIALDENTIRRFRIEPGWRFGMQKRVEWSDVDAFSHVNHLVYMRWCEEVRNAYLEELGLPRITPASAGVVIKSIRFDYHAPLGFMDDIVVTARTTAIRKTSFRMDYAVWKDGLVGRGDAICILMINDTGERVPVSDALRQAMTGRDEAREETS
jgi:acyl-CoA thioester hydrolase